MVNLTTISQLISANHILSYYNVLDALGHVSVRNPDNSSTFFLSADRAPALVASPADIVEYRISDAQPVDPSAPQGYIERYIHSEIMKRYPTVNSVVHSHSENIVPYTLVDVPLQPIFPPSSGLGFGMPNFDPETVYNSTQIHDLLIRDPKLGAALASLLSSQPNSTNSTLVHEGILQRGHGFSMTGPSIEIAVYRAIYAQVSARMQSTAIQLAAASGVGVNGIKYMSTREWMDAATGRDFDRAWELWIGEVSTYPGGLYQNSVGYFLTN
jgi:ribulose-5-phosphate 4-epimerase/fuculose-1-phosphate aldolase